VASITSWTRLEPRVRREDPAEALQARLHDPLWLLARQWQVGEFTGEDAGSPLRARALVERAPLTRYLPGPPSDAHVEAAPYDPARLPLEVLVERESGSHDLRLSFEAGLHFFRLLERHGVGAYRKAFLQHYPLVAGTPDPRVEPETARLLRTAHGRIPDGGRIAADVRSAPNHLPAAPEVEPDDEAAVIAAARALLAWHDRRTGSADDRADGGAAPPWNPERMEYDFAVSAPAENGETVLVASEHAHGHLDWYSFDRRLGAVLGAKADSGQRELLLRSAIPAPVTYRGMPVNRWWEFEDGQVNFGGTDAEPSNLLRLLLIGFALDYGNDWFLLPVELPSDALHRVTSLVVTDSFGIDTLVRPYTFAQGDGSHWRMFSLSADGDADPTDEAALFLPPSLAPSLHGEPVEEVLLVRDEIANLAWAIERRVEDAGGRPFDRVERYRRDRPAREPNEPAANADSGSDGDLRYRLATPVPDYWVPLVPVRVDPDEPDVRLVRGRVLLDGEDVPTAPPPLGRLLEPGRPLRLFEEEVGRTGVRLTRTYQYARWTDGSGHLWIGRRKGAGRGEAASGLRFDTLEPE
jgi:hypothetical protein